VPPANLQKESTATPARSNPGAKAFHCNALPEPDNAPTKIDHR